MSEASHCPVKPTTSADHAVTVENLRPNLIDNVLVTSRSTHGHFAFGTANNWSHSFGLIPSKSGLINRNHKRTKTTSITATGPEGNDDSIGTDVEFTYSTQTTKENINGVTYLLQIRK